VSLYDQKILKEKEMETTKQNKEKRRKPPQASGTGRHATVSALPICTVRVSFILRFLGNMKNSELCVILLRLFEVVVMHPGKCSFY
jgi:hypothetical protein